MIINFEGGSRLSNFVILDQDFASLNEITKRMRYCLRNEIGFSLVRVGDAENQVMAQGHIFSEEEIRQIWWAQNIEWTGITLPNYPARDQVIASVRKADVVGVLHQEGTPIWRNLTEELFTNYRIKPKQLCYAFVNTYFPDSRDFLTMMCEHKLLLIGNPAYNFAGILKNKFGIRHVAAIPINSFDEIDKTLHMADRVEYDLALISAGSNALILTTKLAERGKVAIDFGRAMNPEYWSKYPSHPHNIFNANKVRQPLIQYYPARNQAFHAPADIKGDLTE